MEQRTGTITTGTKAPPVGTCLACGAQVRIVNHTPATPRMPELGYLGRHHRAGTREGTKCRGSFGGWVEKKRTNRG